MIRKILVAIDYSDASLNALETAIWIAGHNKAMLQILHVQEVDLAAGQRGHMKEVAEAMIGSIVKQHGLQADLLFAEGFAGPEIVKSAAASKANLIVAGAHGASGMRELFVGTTAYYMMKNAACPVLIVPEGRKWQAFKHILLPMRTSFGSFKRYEYIKALSSGLDTQVEVFALSVDTAPVAENALQLMGKKIQGGTTRQSLRLAVHFSGEKNIAREVLDRADRMSADLVVLSPAVDVINKQFFIGPFSQRIIHQARVPVLYVR